MSSAQNPPRNWSDAWAVYTHPRVLAMLFLGFAAGLPLLLVFGTLSAWLRQAGVDRATIGHVSWVALAYAFKFVWAPLVDRIDLPLLNRLLGHRRSWMLLAQAGIITGLLLMATGDPRDGLEALVWAALLVAFSSATQDISLDAWRIEAVDIDRQAAMAATYQIGYRIGMIAAGAGALYVADFLNWGAAYTTMAGLMGVGVLTTLLIGEPERRVGVPAWREEARVVAFMDRSAHLPRPLQAAIAWLIGAVVAPFAEFFQRNGRFALWVLAFIFTFRISDITLGVMANAFYIDMGYTLSEIATVTKIFGVIMTMIGAVLGGVVVMHFGLLRVLLLAAVIVALTNLVYAWLATQPAEVMLLAIVVSADNLSGGLAGSAFIAYLSGQTNRAYTATQYALFSSMMLMPAKFLAGFSGDIIDATSYPVFFTYASALGIPAILLVLMLMRRERRGIQG